MGLLDKMKAKKSYETGKAMINSSSNSLTNTKYAAMHLQKAISLGSIDAYTALATCYSSDKCGVKKDYSQMFEIYLQGSEKGNLECSVQAAVCYLRGLGTERNYENAVSMCDTAIRLFNSKKRTKTVYDSVTFEETHIILTICGLLGYGEKVKNTKEENIHFLKNVSQKEQNRNYHLAILAEYGLAICYHQGIAVDRDIRKAIYHYEKVVFAEQWDLKIWPQDADVFYLLGCIYLESEEIIPDYELALFYLNRAAKEYQNSNHTEEQYSNIAKKISLAKEKLEKQEMLETRIRMLSALFATVDDAAEQKLIHNAEKSDCIEDWILLAQEYTYGNNIKKDIRKALYCVFRCMVVGKPQNMQITLPCHMPLYAQKELDKAKAKIRGGKELDNAARILEQLVEKMDCAEAKYLLMNLSGEGEIEELYCSVERLEEQGIKMYKKAAKDSDYPLAINNIPAMAYWSALGKQEALDELERVFYKVFQFDYETRTASMPDGKFILNRNKLNDKQMCENELNFTLEQYQKLWHILWTWNIQLHEYLARRGNCPSMCQLGVLWSRIGFETGEPIDSERKKYWRYEAIKADYLPVKLYWASTKYYSSNIAEIEQAISYANEGMRYNIAHSRESLEALEYVLKKEKQNNKNVSYMEQQQVEQKIATEMDAYRNKLNYRELFFSFLDDDRPMTNEEDMYYRMLMGEREGMENNYLWSLQREEYSTKKNIL